MAGRAEAVAASLPEARAALTDLTPPFASTQDALALDGASRTSLRTDTTPGRAVPLADVTDRARALGGRDPATVDGVVSAFARDQMLSFVGLSDEALVARGRLGAALWRSAGLVALVVLDRLRALVGGLHEWWTLRDRRGQLVEVREARDEVVRCVAAALDRADGARA